MICPADVLSSPILCFHSVGDRKLVILAAVVMTSLLAETAIAQNFRRRPARSTVQLPQVSFFQFQTTVSVPDGGVLHAGGVGRSATTLAPGIYGGSGYSSSTAASGFSISATILSQQEIDQYLTAEGDRLAAIRAASDPNGSSKTQQKADFLSRHIGKSSSNGAR